jgi:hypothetical protein
MRTRAQAERSAGVQPAAASPTFSRQDSRKPPVLNRQACFAAQTLVFAFCALSLFTNGFAASELLQRAAQLEESGKFTEASALFSQALQDRTLPPNDRAQLEFELDRLARIRKDYPLIEEQLFTKLSASVASLSRSDFETWIAEGRFDKRDIDGVRYFMGSSVANLFFRYPELNPRRRPRQDETEVQRKTLEVSREIKRAALAEGKRHVLPLRFKAIMAVTVSPGAAPAGETIRAWLPIPRDYPYQGGLELTSSSSAPRHIGGPQSPIRSLLLEQPSAGIQPTRFQTFRRHSTDPVPNRIQLHPLRSLFRHSTRRGQAGAPARRLAETVSERSASRGVYPRNARPLPQAHRPGD